jgi:thiamine biosynthesis protein ThiI
VTGARLVLLRFSGEIATKARATRSRFAARLLHNLRDALATEGIAAGVRRTHDRIFVETDHPTAPDVLARLFGIQSLSVAVARPAPSLEAVVEAGSGLFRKAVQGRRFAVRARRVGDRSGIPFEAREVERRLGAALRPGAARVDLTEPEVTVRVELHPGEAHFFSDRVQGPGGLPLGVEGRAIALISGGFDSAVAAWRLLKRGVALDFLFCNLGGATHQLGALRVMKVLSERWCYGVRPRLHAIDFEAVAAQLRERTQTRYWQVLLKRLMLRAAETVAHERRAAALVTGEAVGQVSSQTLPNLAVISEAVSLPILRPLAGYNKDEIIAEAKRVGTAELSAVVHEYCAMVPRRPATSASLAVVLAEEARLSAAVLERALAERVVLDLRSLDPEALAIPELDVKEIATGATVIDLRSRAAYEGWHYPSALHLEFGRALAAYRSFSRDATYVLYCEFGLKSAHLAELMQKEGFQAHHFQGGLKPLLGYVRERHPASLAPLDPAGLLD